MAAWLVFELVMQVRQRLRAVGPAAADPTVFVLVPCLAGAVAAAQVLGRRGGLTWPGGLLWPVVAGVTLIAAGLGLRAWSITTLGRLFQYQITIQPGHHVVTSGPYRHVRHPSYSGMALVLAGIALACDDVWSLVAVSDSQHERVSEKVGWGRAGGWKQAGSATPSAACDAGGCGRRTHRRPRQGWGW